MEIKEGWSETTGGEMFSRFGIKGRNEIECCHVQ